jgi:hypothetical protein
MTEDATRRDKSFGLFAREKPADMVCEIRMATATEAQRLLLIQARVIREVIEWVAAQKPSVSGRDRAV